MAKDSMPGSRKRSASEKHSREALSLLNTAFLDSRAAAPSGGRAARTRTSEESERLEPPLQERPTGRGRKGKSAPPAPASDELIKQHEQHADAKPTKKATSSKRAQAPQQVSDAEAENGSKKRKVGGGLELPEQPPLGLQSGRALDSRPSIGLTGGLATNAAANASREGASGEQEQKQARNDKSKSTRRTTQGADAVAQPAAGGSAEDEPTAPAAANGSQPMAGGGAVRRSRGKGQSAAGHAVEAPAETHAQQGPPLGPATMPMQQAGVAPPAAKAGLQRADGASLEKGGQANAGSAGASGGNGDNAGPSGQTERAAHPRVLENGRPEALLQPQARQQPAHRDGSAAAPAAAVAGGQAAATQAAPREVRPGAALPARPPAARPIDKAANVPQAVTRQVAGPGASGSSGSAPQADSAALPGAAAGRPLPVTGTTPVKAFVPVPIPRLDEVGQQDRATILDLQRQLVELRAIYDELKATKIQELEKVLAEQVEYTDEQVRSVEHRAQLWQAAAEHAEQRAKAAGSKEMASRIADLEAQVAKLKDEKGDLLMLLAHRERELAEAQTAFHDLRSKLVRRDDADAGDRLGGEEAGEDGDAEQPASEEVEAQEGDSGAGTDGAEGDEPEQERSPIAGSQDGVTPMPAAGPARLDGREGARAVGLQFPTPSPGIGIQFPTPGTQLIGLQGKLGSAITAPGSGSHSAGRGVSTECLRIVQMLPCLRAPTPSIQSRHASGAVELATQLEAARALGAEDTDVTPTAFGGGGGLQATQPGGAKSRRSTGSPIDGICSVGQRNAGGVNMANDLSFAHGMGAPEAFPLVAQQQEEYSFVDLNPASAQKAPRPAQTAPLATGTAAGAIVDAFGAGGNADKTQQGKEVTERPHGAGRPSAAAMVAMAAATALPHSPGAAAQSRPQVPLATAGSGVLQGALSPGARGMSFAALTRSPSRQNQGAIGALERAAGHMSPAADAAVVAAGILNSGSVMSNQDSCTVSGLVARVRAMQQQIEQRAAANAGLAAQHEDVQGQAAGGSATPVSASKRERVAPSPVRSPLAADIAADQLLQEEQQQPATGPSMEGPAPSGTPQALPSTSPSPRTAKLIMYERMLEWQVNTVSLKPETCRLTHRTCGMSFELREAELDDEEAAEMLCDQQSQGGDGEGGAGPKCFVYTPLELGQVAEQLPTFLKETICIPASQRRELLSMLDKVIKDAAATRQPTGING